MYTCNSLSRIIKAASYLFLLLIVAGSLSAAPEVYEEPALSLGTSIDWKFEDRFNGDIFFENTLPVNGTVSIQNGILTDYSLQNISLHFMLGAERLFDFFSARLNCIYNSFPNYNIAEFTVMGTAVLYNDAIELELGPGWKTLTAYSDMQFLMSYLQLAYRLEVIFLNLDFLRMSAQIGNFNNFTLGNISDVTFSFKNCFVLNKSFQLMVQADIHNPGAWAFSSYYSGMDMILYGVYCIGK